ncbi:MAG: hypothetical protein QXG56_02450 [Candidatus Bathyarchaeia archaeon]
MSIVTILLTMLMKRTHVSTFRRVHPFIIEPFMRVKCMGFVYNSYILISSRGYDGAGIVIYVTGRLPIASISLTSKIKICTSVNRF